MRKLTTEEWITKAKVVHGDKYDYSKVNYNGSDSKVLIICKVHGEFTQKASNHIQGKGCMLCGVNKSAITKVKTQEQFVKEVMAVHDNKYSYEFTKYNGIENIITVVCAIHGKFEIRASNHMQGHGCQKCRIDTVVRKLRTKEEEVLIRFVKVHGDKYNYSKVKHIDMTTLITIICPEHGEFEQIPVAHVSGQGCPSCAKTGFDKNKSAILYYLKIITEDDKMLYKIGITNRTVSERFRLEDLKKIEIIKQEEFENGEDAWNKEKSILEEFKEFKYKGPAVLDSGNTELFTVDVLNMEK